MVTWRSCMASSKALWTLAGERLISSARIRLAKIGPSFGRKAPSLGLKMSVPSRSAGSKSGVNWKRLKDASMVPASARIVNVFAKPGTPSSRMWPLVSRATNIRSISSS